MNNAVLVDIILEKLESVLESKMYDVLPINIVDNFFGGQMELRSAVIQRAQVFESALTGSIGTTAEKILSHICQQIRSEYHFNTHIHY